MSIETDDEECYVDISECAHRDAVCLVVQQEVANRGIALPEGGRSPLPYQNMQKQRKDENQNCCFGVNLEMIQHTELIEVAKDCPVLVPRVLHHMVAYLSNEEHLQQQGLFRKTGSLNRQKELRACICESHNCPEQECSAHDVANLMKHFFRELPDCLLTSELLPTFMSAVEGFRFDQAKLAKNVLDVCLLLPEIYFSTLQYSMRFFHQVASYCEANRMDIDNLAVVLTPNLVRSPSTSCQSLTLQTLLVRTLIENADSLGRVSEGRASAAKGLSSEVDRSRILRQRLSLPRSSPALSARIVLGTCLDARLGEAYSPNIDGTPSEDSYMDITDDSEHDKPLHPRKRRPSLNSLMSSIGHSFARLATPHSHHSSDLSLMSTERMKQAATSPNLLTPCSNSRAEQAEAASPSLRSQILSARSPVKRSKHEVMDGTPRVTRQTPSKHHTGTNMKRVPILVQHQPLSTRKRKGADSDITDVVSPRKRQAMMQNMAQSDRAMKLSASCTSISRVQTRSSAMASSSQMTGPQRALRSAQKMLTTSQRRTLSNKKSSEALRALVLRQDTENMEPGKKEPVNSEQMAGDRHAKALALLERHADKPKEKKTSFRRRLSGGIRRKSQTDSDDRINHIYEVGKRLANRHTDLAASYDAPSSIAFDSHDTLATSAPVCTSDHLSSSETIASFSTTVV